MAKFKFFKALSNHGLLPVFYDSLSDTDSLTFVDTKIAEFSARQFDMPF